MSQTVWPLNENGEIVFSNGSGSSVVEGYLNQDILPSSDNGAIPIVLPQTGTSQFVPKIGLLTAVGNSLVAGSNTNEAGSFARQFATLTEGRLTLLKNSGVGGRKSAEVLVNLSVDVPSETTHLLYHEGTNDATGSTPLTVAQHISNVRTIVRWAKSRNIVPIVVATATVGGAYASSASLMGKYRIAERFMCREEGVLFIDPWQKFIAVDGTWTSSAGASDGLHPNYYCHEEVAKVLAASFNGQKSSYLLPFDNAGSGGLLGSNVLNTTNSWVKTGENVTLTMTTSDVSVSSLGKGKWVDVTATNCVSGITRDIYRDIGSVAGGNFSVGDRIRVSGVFKIPTNSNMKVFVRLYLNSSDSTKRQSIYPFATGQTMQETYFEWEGVVPEGGTNAQIYVRCASLDGTNTYSGTFSFSNVDAYVVKTS